MSSNFPSRVSHVQPNSAVSAGNTSASTRDLEARTNYLKAVIDAIEAGQLLVRREQAVAVDVVEGDAVYWDDENKRFDRALAGVVENEEVNSLLPTASSDCLGICVTKESSTAGTIGLVGMVQVSNDVLESMIDGTTAPGRYYLSSANPGKLVSQRPPVSVAVLYVLGPADDCETASWVYINPQMRDFLEDHIHYEFDLTAEPAGTHTPPSAGNPHTITSADSAQMGWLPADDASFNGNAPEGAMFGYNMAAHTALNNVWPPVPISAAIIEMHQPSLTEIERFEGLERVPSDYITIDKFGIWWMTNCYNQVPWSTTNDTTSSESCPLEPPVRVVLSFLKMTFATDKSVVTSLQPAAGAPLRFVDCEGADATTGDLYASLDTDAMVQDENERGGNVFKSLDDNTLSFNRGWVAEGLIAGSDAVQLTGSNQELTDPEEVESESNPMIHRGLITVDVVTDPTERELLPHITKLNDTLERELGGMTYLAFPPGRDSSLIMEFRVPPAGLPTNPQMKIRTQVFGRATGPFSGILMVYARVARPTAGTPTSVPPSTTSLTYDIVTPTDDYDGGGTDLPADNAIEVESSEFAVSAGDTVFITMTREDFAVPEYNNDIGLLRPSGVIVAGS